MLRMAITSSLCFIPMGALSAPSLTMHIFEQDDSIHAPVLHMHVFTHVKQTSQVADKYPSQARQKKPALGYQQATIYLRTGYRQDKLFWNKAGLNNSPNILSELTWDNLQIATIDTGVSLLVSPSWLVNADFTYGRIFSGDNQDSDYNGDNRTLEFSRSNNGADEGDVYDLSVSAAYRYPINQLIELQPEFGISYHAQNLKLVDGFQTIPATGPFSGLNSTYDATWFGPWLGLSTILRPSNDLSINFDVEYHYINYDSTADWNLRGDRAHPESFTHEADGYGLVTRIEGQYKYSSQLTFDLALNYQKWRADRNGIDRNFFANGTVIDLRFNEVEWRTFGLSFGINYDF